jgi:diadenosine tetraphosphate (Ap4A) HIT family hydrolase
VSDIADIDELSWSDQIQVLKASNLISKLMKTLYKPDKMNVASLGNIVNQLHIHHVCRYTTDETWPGPIWGQGTKDVYTPSQIESTILELKTALQQFYKGEKHDNNHDK